MQDVNKPGTELLADLADRIADHLERSKRIDESAARQLAEDIAYEMADAWGGQLIYFPKGKFALLSKRDRQIFSEFTGHNHADLARKYKVSVQHIYRIIKIMTRRELADRHGDLFAEPDTTPA